jgi:hypothetical protein
VALEQRDDVRAAARLRESLGIWRDVNLSSDVVYEPAALVYILRGLGRVAVARGAVHRSVRLLGFAEAFGTDAGCYVRAPCEQAAHAAAVADACARLDGTTFVAAWARGRR